MQVLQNSLKMGNCLRLVNIIVWIVENLEWHRIMSAGLTLFVIRISDSEACNFAFDSFFPKSLRSKIYWSILCLMIFLMKNFRKKSKISKLSESKIYLHKPNRVYLCNNAVNSNIKTHPKLFSMQNQVIMEIICSVVFCCGFRKAFLGLW